MDLNHSSLGRTDAVFDADNTNWSLAVAGVESGSDLTIVVPNARRSSESNESEYYNNKGWVQIK